MTEQERKRAETILNAVGIAIWVSTEQLLDAVTAVSGSGPAYCFLLMELMASAGEKLGLEKDLAIKLTLQTMYGAAKMAMASTEAPGTLRERVTSPGGTTERALEIFADGEMENLVFHLDQDPGPAFKGAL